MAKCRLIINGGYLLPVYGHSPWVVFIAISLQVYRRLQSIETLICLAIVKLEDGLFLQRLKF